MPVEFSNSSLDEMLLSARDIMARWQVLDDLFTDPTAFQETSLGVGEAPFEVGNNAVVSGLLTQVVWVLEVKFLVCAACHCVSM